MEQSILISTKKILGIPNEYQIYDLDIITHINTALQIVYQLGVGPAEDFFIEGVKEKWDDFDIPQNQLNVIRTYVFLKVKTLFDPPTIGYLVDATDRQLNELEWRLNVIREGMKYPMPEEDNAYGYTSGRSTTEPV